MFIRRQMFAGLRLDMTIFNSHHAAAHVLSAGGGLVVGGECPQRALALPAEVEQRFPGPGEHT